MTTPGNDPRVWSELTGFPVTGVEVVPGGTIDGCTIDGQRVTSDDKYLLEIDGCDNGDGNGVYVVTTDVPQP